LAVGAGLSMNGNVGAFDHGEGTPHPLSVGLLLPFAPTAAMQVPASMLATTENQLAYGCREFCV
jgi:hypothetical protein